MEIFLNPKPLTSFNSVLYLNKKMSKQVRAEIDRWSDIYIEQGYSIKVKRTRLKLISLSDLILFQIETINQIKIDTLLVGLRQLRGAQENVSGEEHDLFECGRLR